MSRDPENNLALAENLVTYGRSRGASEIEVSIRETSEFTASVREQNVERLTEADAKDLGIRIFVEGKAAVAASQDFAPTTLHRIVDNAITRARLGGVDALAGLPDLEPVGISADTLRIYDPAVLELSPESKIAAAMKVEAVGLADKRINKSSGASFSSVLGLRYLANSKGFSGSYRWTSVSSGVNFQAGEGDDFQEDGWVESSTSAAGLPAPEAIARIAVQRVTRLIGARKVESQNVPVVLEPYMTANLILFFLTQCLAGANIDRRQSFLLDKLGWKIGSGLMTIYNDGQLPGGLGTSLFDAEGVPARKTLVMDHGVLKSFLLNTYYGRKLKMAYTGNGGEPGNFHLAKGVSKPADIIKSVDKGLLLTGMGALGQDPTTGDISTGVSGLWIEKGEVVFPVAGVTVSGNLGDVLRGVEMVGDDLEFNDNIVGPTIKVAQMTIGGKGTARGGEDR